MSIPVSEFLISLSKLSTGWKIYKRVLEAEQLQKERGIYKGLLCDAVLQTLTSQSLFTPVYSCLHMCASTLIHLYIHTITCTRDLME